MYDNFASSDVRTFIAIFLRMIIKTIYATYDCWELAIFGCVYGVGAGEMWGVVDDDDEDDDGMWRTTTRMQRSRHRVEHWPARKHVCVCAGSERFSTIAPEPPTSLPPTHTDPLAAATRATAHPHWSAALRPATVADRFPRNLRPPPSKPTRPYMHIILIVIVSVIAVYFEGLPKKRKLIIRRTKCIIPYYYEHASHNAAGIKRASFWNSLLEVSY